MNLSTLFAALVAAVCLCFLNVACVSSERTLSAQERLQQATERWSEVQEHPDRFTAEETLDVASQLASALTEYTDARAEDARASAQGVAALGAAGGAGAWGLVVLGAKLVAGIAGRKASRGQTQTQGIAPQGGGGPTGSRAA